eukprot:TRINITY_DN6080_c0_g7_i1.p1 TRINITY_DN6080_c0_g7~~TRINITY_DN6080_c0_g7_i1.p1  ORF type:complete len:1398 (+),score=351.18 TRINITY_DN6080_c0_g7_i1:584-4195(+)
MAHYFQKGYRTGMRLRASLILMVYRKALRVSPWASMAPVAGRAPAAGGAAADAQPARRCWPCCRRRRAAEGAAAARPGGNTVGGIGQMTNLISSDTDKFIILMPYFNLLWSAPLQLVICFAMLIAYVQWALLAGLFVMFFFTYVSGVVQRKARGFQADCMKAKDERLKLQVEMLKIVKIIKLYAWETTIEARVKELRDKELYYQLKYKLWNMLIFVSFSLSPTLVALSTFACYVGLMGKRLDAATAFTSLSLFNILTFPLGFLPMLYGFLIQARVSAARLEAFLLAEEVGERPGPPRSPGMAVELEAAKLNWPDGSELLSDVSFAARPGEVVAVVGRTGTGKSGLLYALLGELKVDADSGFAALGGSVAYCAQSAWVRNAKLRDNITGGARMIDTARYEAVLEACALRQDLEVLPDGDATLIGDRGINLSGGQKQRVALARAVYADADVYIFDDILSALDAHVAAHICNNLLRGPLLRGKTVVLVTHSRRALPLADRVFALGDKRVKFSGTYEEFRRTGIMDELEVTKEDDDLTSATSAGDSTSANGGSAVPNGGAGSPKAVAAAADGSAKKPTTAPSGQQPTKAQQEERRQGAVSFAVYRAYASACGGFLPVGFFLLTVALSEGSKNLSDAWLTHWTRGAKGGGSTDGLIVYAMIAGITLVTGVLYTATRVFIGQAGSRRLHERCVHALLRAQMTFFDQTPTGQVQNRLAEDTATLDDNLPRTAAANLVWAWRSAAIVVVCCLVGWYLFVLIIPMFLIYGRLARRYLPATRDLRRLDSVAKSPIFHHFGETVNGVSTIRAMQQQESAFWTNVMHLEKQMEAYYLSNTAPRWLSLRLQFCGTVLVGAVASIGIFMGNSGKLSASVVGIAITYAMKLTDTLNQVNREAADRETQMVSVERLHQYITSIKPEAALQAPGENLPLSWPTQGDVSLNEITMRYRPELPVVLDGITVDIKRGERVGVVGRTGCGKSSLLLTLMRVVELERGSISIDGVNVASIGLHSLRRRAAIIPQDPAILTGSVRFNLDPFKEKSDEELWYALEKAQLKARVENAGGLDSRIEEGGGNYSVGEMQLLCLARALLRRQEEGGLLLLDEATSALDSETDKTIQSAIRSEFKCTTITIAHRIQTLLDYDRILVLNEGRLMENGSPEELLNNMSSTFRALAIQDGVSVSPAKGGAEASSSEPDATPKTVASRLNPFARRK